jgi:hypothetical protein
MVEQTHPPEDDPEIAAAVEHILEAEHDLARAHAEEVQAEHKLERAVEELEHAEHDKDVWVIVNGRRKEVHKHHLTFEEVVALAFSEPPQGDGVQFTVQYTRGPEKKPSGTLVEGQSVKVKDGMEFDVTTTNRS